MTAPDAATDLSALSSELLEKAAAAPARRASRTLAHPVDGLRQTVMALLAGEALGEHESPGAASLQVLRGEVRIDAEHGATRLGAGQIAPVPMTRHGLHADADSVVLLSVAIDVRAAH
jgi:quercetin dioxygenase-like cupin family protein